MTIKEKLSLLTELKQANEKKLKEWKNRERVSDGKSHHQNPPRQAFR